MPQTALIAGASRGIGLELVRQYAEDGYRVIAGCRQPESAADLQALVESLNIEVYQLDTASDESVSHFAAKVGDDAVEVVIVTAGTQGGEQQAFGAFDFDAFADTLNTNTAGPVRIAQALASNISNGQHGKLIAITSGMGSIEQTTSTEMMAYRISKAALNEAWKCVSIEMKGKGVTAMVIHPGWVATDMGGKDAPVSPQASAAGIKKVIDDLGIADAGTFKTWEGEAVSW